MDKRENVQDSNDNKSTMPGHVEAMPTNMRGIEIFVRIVESGSFVAAARSLLIDPAAVSRAVKALEEDLGISLVVRSTRAFKLTTEGARFYREGAQLLRTFDDTIDRFRADTAAAWTAQGRYGSCALAPDNAAGNRLISNAAS